MTKTAVSQIGKIVGQSINAYYPKVKPAIDDLKFKEQYQGRIIDCMVGEVDDNYIETPETDAPVVKLEYSKEGLVKVPSIKGRTILVDAEGNETDTPGEGCRLVSVGEDEDNKVIILSNNKNLLRKELIEKRTWMDTNGVVQQNNDNYVTKFIRVEKNSIYKNNASFTFYWLYDESKEFIGFQKGAIVTTNSASYVKFGKSWSFSSNGEYDFSNSIICKVNHMNDVVEYIPHRSHKTEILLDNSLNNIQEVCDFIKDNMFYRTTKKILLRDYPDDWNVNTGWTNDDFLVISRTFEDRKPKSYLTSNLFPTMTYSQSLVDGKVGKECVRCESSSQAIYIFIKKERLETKDVIGFTKWLETSDMEVIYELEEPIMEELPNSITLQGFDDTTMYIENSITPTIQYGYNALIPYKEELSNQKEEVETNTLDIENNIIPYLMDMEYNLMLMEDN